MWVRRWKEPEEAWGATVYREESELMEEPGEALDIFAEAMFNECGFAQYATTIDDIDDEEIKLDIVNYVTTNDMEQIQNWFDRYEGDIESISLNDITNMLKAYL